MQFISISPDNHTVKQPGKVNCKAELNRTSVINEEYWKIKEMFRLELEQNSANNYEARKTLNQQLKMLLPQSTSLKNLQSKTTNENEATEDLLEMLNAKRESIILQREMAARRKTQIYENIQNEAYKRRLTLLNDIKDLKDKRDYANALEAIWKSLGVTAGEGPKEALKTTMFQPGLSSIDEDSISPEQPKPLVFKLPTKTNNSNPDKINVKDLLKGLKLEDCLPPNTPPDSDHNQNEPLENNNANPESVPKIIEPNGEQEVIAVLPKEFAYGDNMPKGINAKDYTENFLYYKLDKTKLQKLLRGIQDSEVSLNLLKDALVASGTEVQDEAQKMKCSGLPETTINEELEKISAKHFIDKIVKALVERSIRKAERKQKLGEGHPKFSMKITQNLNIELSHHRTKDKFVKMINQSSKDVNKHRSGTSSDSVFSNESGKITTPQKAAAKRKAGTNNEFKKNENNDSESESSELEISKDSHPESLLAESKIVTQPGNQQKPQELSKFNSNKELEESDKAQNLGQNNDKKYIKQTREKHKKITKKLSITYMKNKNDLNRVASSSELAPQLILDNVGKNPMRLSSTSVKESVEEEQQSSARKAGEPLSGFDKSEHGNDSLLPENEKSLMGTPSIAMSGLSGRDSFKTPSNEKMSSNTIKPEIQSSVTLNKAEPNKNESNLMPQKKFPNKKLLKKSGTAMLPPPSTLNENKHIENPHELISEDHTMVIENETNVQGNPAIDSEYPPELQKSTNGMIDNNNRKNPQITKNASANISTTKLKTQQDIIPSNRIKSNQTTIQNSNHQNSLKPPKNNPNLNKSNTTRNKESVIIPNADLPLTINRESNQNPTEHLEHLENDENPDAEYVSLENSNADVEVQVAAGGEGSARSNKNTPVKLSTFSNAAKKAGKALSKFSTASPQKQKQGGKLTLTTTKKSQIVHSQRLQNVEQDGEKTYNNNDAELFDKSDNIDNADNENPQINIQKIITPDHKKINETPENLKFKITYEDSSPDSEIKQNIISKVPLAVLQKQLKQENIPIHKLSISQLKGCLENLQKSSRSPIPDGTPSSNKGKGNIDNPITKAIAAQQKTKKRRGTKQMEEEEQKMMEDYVKLLQDAEKREAERKQKADIEKKKREEEEAKLKQKQAEEPPVEEENEEEKEENLKIQSTIGEDWEILKDMKDPEKIAELLKKRLDDTKRLTAIVERLGKNEGFKNVLLQRNDADYDKMRKCKDSLQMFFNKQNLPGFFKTQFDEEATAVRKLNIENNPELQENQDSDHEENKNSVKNKKLIISSELIEDAKNGEKPLSEVLDKLYGNNINYHMDANGNPLSPRELLELFNTHLLVTEEVLGARQKDLEKLHSSLVSPLNEKREVLSEQKPRTTESSISIINNMSIKPLTECKIRSKKKRFKVDLDILKLRNKMNKVEIMERRYKMLESLKSPAPPKAAYKVKMDYYFA